MCTLPKTGTSSLVFLLPQAKIRLLKHCRAQAGTASKEVTRTHGNLALPHQSGARGTARVLHSSGLLFTHISEQGEAIRSRRARAAELLLCTAEKPHLLGVCVKKTPSYRTFPRRQKGSCRDLWPRHFTAPEEASVFVCKQVKTPLHQHVLFPVPRLHRSLGEAPGLADTLQT